MSSQDDLMQFAIKEWKLWSLLLVFFSKMTLFKGNKVNKIERRPRNKMQSAKMHYYGKDVSGAFPFF